MQTEKTVDSCFMLPVSHREIGSLRDFWDDAGEKYGADVEGHFKLFGVRNVLVFLQTMPGDVDYLVVYLRSRDGLDKTLRGLFGENLPCSKYLARRFENFTGLDLSKPENVPKVDVLMDWRETHEFLEERNMLLMPWCMAAPIRPGKTAELRKYVGEVAPFRGEWEKLLRDRDIVRNAAFLQHTPQGDYVVKYVVASNTPEELMKAFQACGSELCKKAWTFSREVTGIDFSDPKNMPELKLLFKWDETRGFDTAEQAIAYTE